jgi:hypothetical protein
MVAVGRAHSLAALIDLHLDRERIATAPGSGDQQIQVFVAPLEAGD